MIVKNILLKPGLAGIVSTASCLLALTACVGYVDGPAATVAVEPGVVVATDDYIYYPAYGVYYSSYGHQYAYMDGGVFVSRPAPMGVSVDVLLASPSVRMDFHDSPSFHQAAMARTYPRTWTAQGAAAHPAAPAHEAAPERAIVPAHVTTPAHEAAPAPRAAAKPAPKPAQKEEHEEHGGK